MPDNLIEQFKVGAAVLTMAGRRKLYVCRIDADMRYPILCGRSRDAEERDLSGWKPTELEILP